MRWPGCRRVGFVLVMVALLAAGVSRTQVDASGDEAATLGPAGCADGADQTGAPDADLDDTIRGPEDALLPSASLGVAPSGRRLDWPPELPPPLHAGHARIEEPWA